MKQVEGTGNGKVILLGEHAVVHDRPALAMTLDRGVTVTLTDLPRPPEFGTLGTEAFRQMADQAGVGAVHAKSDSDLPDGAGLGSSAAFCVAAARALLAWRQPHDTDPSEPGEKDVLWLAGIGESVFHGNPSGLDAELAARPAGTVLRFKRGATAKITPVPAPHGVPLVIADTGDRGSTKDQVAAVAAVLNQNWKSRFAIGALLDVLEALVGTSPGFLADANWHALGKSFDAAQSILARLGVSTPRIETACKIARDAGAAGAKLTGAGGGGCIIALPGEGSGVASALEAAGYPCWVVS